MRRKEKSRVVIQLRFDELLPSFSHLSPMKKNAFPLSPEKQENNPCSNPTKSDNSISQDSTIAQTFRENKLKSEQLINDSSR
jgi:hypothetical protein